MSARFHDGGRYASGKALPQRRRPRKTGRSLVFEALEQRQLLAATNLGSITGRVFHDLNNNGFTAGEQVVGATLKLLQDSPTGTVLKTATTDSLGRYYFAGLSAGTYYVQQQAQTDLSQKTSSAINISASDAQGTGSLTIDDFTTTPQQTVLASVPVGQAVTSQRVASEVLGGERDLSATMTSGSASDSVTLAAGNGVLIANTTWSPSGGAAGDYLVTWDGVDDSPTLNYTGLRAGGSTGIDLTSSSKTHLLLNAALEKSGGQLQVRVYSDSTHFSQAAVPLSATTGQDILLAYNSTDFVAQGSQGGADFSNVGAIVLETVLSTPANRGQLAAVRAVAPKVADFSNAQEADLSLTQNVSPTSPSVGQTVTFTLNLVNGGPSTTTGVKVTDVLPSGVTYTGSAATQGTYNATTGVWDVGSLAAGATGVTLQISATVKNAGTIVNTAQVSASSLPDPNTQDNQASVTLASRLADLSLTMSADTLTPSVSRNVVYTLTVTNAGPSTATGVQLTDLLPSSLGFVNAVVSQGTYDSTSGVWNIGSVSVGAVQTMQLTALVKASGSIVSKAEITHSDQPDPNSTPSNNVSTEDDQKTITVNSQQANLTLTQIVDAASPQVNQDVTFTITLRNAGPSAATNVVVQDTLPAGFSLLSTTPSLGSAGTLNNGVIQWSIPTLAANGNATWQLKAKVIDHQALTNAAEVAAVDQTDPNSTPNNHVTSEDDQASVTVTPQIADLSLSSTANQTRPNVGDKVTFALTLNNAGPNPAVGVVVSDLLPDGLAYDSSSTAQGTYDSNTGQWSVGTLGASGRALLTLIARVVSVGAKVNTAEVGASGTFDPNSVPGNLNATENDYSSLTITPQQADLSLKKEVDNASPNVGESIAFTITLHNDGPDAATNVQVRDILPAGLHFQSSVASHGTYDPTTGIWSVPSLASRTDATLRVSSQATQIGVQLNDAEVVKSDQFDLDSTPGNHNPAEDDQASAQATPQSADLSLKTTVSPTKPNVGDLVTFTLTLQNAGPNKATGVVVQNRLPAGLTLVKADPSVGTFNKTTGEWNLPEVAVGASLTLGLQAKVDTLGKKTDTAEVTVSQQFDSDSTPGNGISAEDDYASVDVTPQSADLSVTAAVDTRTPNVGKPVTYTITVLNAGPDAATRIQVKSLLPDGLTLASATPDQGGLYDRTTGVWSLDTVDSGSSAKLVLVANVDKIGDKALTAEIIAADQADPDSTVNNHLTAEDDQKTLTVTPQSVDLALTKTDSPDPVYSGRTLTYTLTVTNAGPSIATGVKLTDTLPVTADTTQTPLVTYASAVPSQGQATASSGVVTVDFGNIAVGASASVTLVVTVDPKFEGQMQNAAEVQADQFDINTANNISTAATGVRLPPATIKGVVFLDLFQATTTLGTDGNPIYQTNGQQDAREPGIAGVELLLYRGHRTETLQDLEANKVAPYRTVFTGPDGTYLIGDLRAEQYTLYERQPKYFADGSESTGNDHLGWPDPIANDKFFFALEADSVSDGINFADQLFSGSRPVALSAKSFLASTFRP